MKNAHFIPCVFINNKNILSDLQIDTNFTTLSKLSHEKTNLPYLMENCFWTTTIKEFYIKKGYKI